MSTGNPNTSEHSRNLIDIGDDIRNPSKAPKPGNGPKVGEKGEYLPSAYKIGGDMVREDR